MPPVLSQATLEVRYRRGMVFLDRCGSTMVALEDALRSDGMGSARAPSMEFGELTCPTDRLAVRFGPKSMSVFQHWIETPTRVQLVAPKAWKVVAAALNLERDVTRAGIRFVFQWPSAESAKHTDVLTKHGLMALPHKWTDLFGTPELVNLTAVAGLVRTEITTVQQETGVMVPEDLRKMVAPFAIQLDLDIAHPDCPLPFGPTTNDDKAFALGAGQLKDFLMDSWRQAKDISQRFGRILEESPNV